jgi:hypothetical protein
MIRVLQYDWHGWPSGLRSANAVRDAWMTGQPVGYMDLSEVNPSPAELTFEWNSTISTACVGDLVLPVP